MHSYAQSQVEAARDTSSAARRERRLATVAEAATYARLNQETIRRRIKDGSLPALRMDRLIRVDLNDLDELFTPRPVDAAAEKIADYVQRVVERAGPLTPADADRIAALLRGGVR